MDHYQQHHPSVKYFEAFEFMENNNNNPSSSRTDRKTIERNRRNQMKALYSQLNSLVPHQSSMESTPLSDQLEEAANYIKRLQINLERMREKKDRLMGVEKTSPSMIGGTTMAGLESPHFEIHEKGSALEVVLITGLDFQFMFSETIRLLHEEGAEIVNASFSVVNDTVFHTIHAKVGDCGSGHRPERISERLKKLVH